MKYKNILIAFILLTVLLTAQGQESQQGSTVTDVISNDTLHS